MTADLVIRALVESAFSRHIEAVGRRPAPMDDDHAARIAAGEQYVSDDLASSIVLVDNGDHLVVNNVAVAPPVKAPVAPRVVPTSSGASEFGFVHTD